MPKRLTVSLKRQPALQVTRVSIGSKKMVYVILAGKPVRYRYGRSRVVYIGTTSRGIARIAASVAFRAEDVLKLHGVRNFTVHILTCAARPRVKTWEKLERAMLLAFRRQYGDLPKCNTQGKRMKDDKPDPYFRQSRIEKLVVALG